MTSTARRLTFVTLAGLLLRAAALAWSNGIPCLLDECSYLTLSRALAGGEGFLPHARHYWPPGYIFFLAGHFAAGGGVLAAKVSQVALSTLLVPLAYALGWRAARAWGPEAAGRAGQATAILIALDPTLIAFSHYLWPETLFLPLFTGGLLLLADLATGSGTRIRSGLALAAPAGILFGAACLVKVLPIYLVPLLAAWLVARGIGERRGRWLAAAILLGSMAAIIAPWTLRNWIVHHRFIPIETTTGKNLVRGNNPYGPSNWDWGATRRAPSLVGTGCEQENLVELNACLSRLGMSRIVSHPGRFLRDAGTKVADLVSPTSFAVRHVRMGVYGKWPRAMADGTVLTIAVFNTALMALSVLGWRRAPASTLKTICLLSFLYILGVHILTFGMSRFRLPAEPLLAAGAALALSGPGAAPARSSWRGRWITAALFAALLACWGARVDGLFYEPPPGVSLPPLGVDDPRPEG